MEVLSLQYCHIPLGKSRLKDMILYKAVDNRRQGSLQAMLETAFPIHVLFNKHLSIIQHISHQCIAMINKLALILKVFA